MVRAVLMDMDNQSIETTDPEEGRGAAFVLGVATGLIILAVMLWADVLFP